MGEEPKAILVKEMKPAVSLGSLSGGSNTIGCNSAAEEAQGRLLNFLAHEYITYE